MFFLAILNVVIYKAVQLQLHIVIVVFAGGTESLTDRVLSVLYRE